MTTERWPPVYDADDLKQYIVNLAGRSERDLYKAFYAASTDAGGAFCQGDVVENEVAVPLIDETGEAVAEGTSKFWLLIGNSCDFDRPLTDVPWTQLVPVQELRLDEPAVMNMLPDARAYKYVRHFFLPQWNGTQESILFLADFRRPVTVHRTGIGKFKVVARMDRAAWTLLHSCLVRFLARDDGRFD